MGKKAIVKCPICGKENDYFAEPLGPFCSDRCKIIDLGKWLGEDYRVSRPLSPEDLEDVDENQEGDKP